MLLRMVDPRDEQRAWLRAILAKTGLSPHALAGKARISAPTLTVFLNSKSAKHALSARTIAALEGASGMRYGPEPRISGFSEGEAQQYNPREPSAVGEAVRALIGQANGVDPWRLRSRALETAGYIPGDILVVDLNGAPKAGDVVCAQLYDWSRSKAETAFRIWEPPFLVAATQDPMLRKSYLVDGENVIIRGVVIATIRPRQMRAA